MINKYNNISKNIRKNILKLSFKAKSSHIGSSLSIVEILVVLYFKILIIKYIFIISIGHAGIALYCTLYEKKIISLKSLNSYGDNGTILMNHVSSKVKGVNFSTGSLGHGLPVSVGKALKLKSDNNKGEIYTIISDGELNEGTTWESLMFASHHKLDNLKIIIDYNKIQSMDFVHKVIKIEPLKSKLKSFGCEVIEIDGHSAKKIIKVLNTKKKNKPKIIIAHTIKGKGVSFMENNNLWHYKNPNLSDLKKALAEINK